MMKRVYLMGLLSTIATMAYADGSVRNLKSHPLTRQEQKAFRAAKSFAKELGVTIHEKCINADSEAESVPVTLQFYNKIETSCQDSHHSIEVDFNKKGDVNLISLTDA